MPRVKDDIEQVVVSRFLATLGEMGRRLEIPVRPPADHPDFELGASINSIGIELTGLVNFENARKQDIRNRYLVQIVQSLSDGGTYDKLCNFIITLDDRYQMPMYPPPESNQGRKLALEIADLLRNELVNLHSCDVRVRARRWRDESHEPAIGALFERKSEQSRGGVDISFIAGYPELVETADLLLTRRIEEKVDKYEHFSHPGPLWLLVYPDSILPSYASDEAIAQARDYLGRISNSPFDEVWYTVPCGTLLLYWLPCYPKPRRWGEESGHAGGSSSVLASLAGCAARRVEIPT
jgi:hypothetical protein